MVIQKHRLIGPLMPVRYENTSINYTNIIKCLGVTIDNRLTWREHIGTVCKSYNKQIYALKNIRYLPSKLLEEVYLKKVIPKVMYVVGVWGNCSFAMFQEIENINLKAARIIRKIPKNVKDWEVLQYAKWQDLGYMYKRRLVIEVFKEKGRES
jgi:hypothetical protein